MKLLCSILLLSVSNAAVLPYSKEASLYGRTATNHLAKIEDAPYVGLIRDNSGGVGYYCGATILTKNWLLTAARCVLWGSKGSNPTDISVWTGVDSFSSNETMHQVQKIYIHEKYIKDSVDYNIALLKLKNSLNFGDDRGAISVNQLNDRPSTGDTLQVFGFPTNFNKDVKPLTHVSMEVVDQDLCQKKYPEIENLSLSATFCGEVKNRCSYFEDCAFNFGDSAVYDGKLAGILSVETVQNYPGIFTNLSHYNDWILNLIPELKDSPILL